MRDIRWWRLSTDLHRNDIPMTLGHLPFLGCIPGEGALSPVLVQTGNEQTVVDFMLKYSYWFLPLLKQYARETIYIKVVFYVFYKHSISFSLLCTQRRRSHFFSPRPHPYLPCFASLSRIERLSLHCSPNWKIMDLINWSLNAIDTILSSGSDQRRISGCGTEWAACWAGFTSPVAMSCVYGVCAFVLLRCFSCSHTVLPKEHSLGVIFFLLTFLMLCCIFLQFYLHFTTDYTCMIVYVTNNKEPWCVVSNL